MAITASYSPATFELTVTGSEPAENISIMRNAAGTILVNGGAVPITGGVATIANTSLISVSGAGGDDVILINEVNGALPSAELSGGMGDDTITGGSAADTLMGEDGDDILLGKGGSDLLLGGIGNDTLTGGDGDDQMFGDDGNDRMIWNPGDDSDLMEGGLGSDIAEVNGGGGAEVFTITANGTRVRFDRLDPAPFLLDIGTTESLVLNAGGGDDTISTAGNLAALIALTLDGGSGNDTILGGNGIDTLLGGDGNDFVDGNQGNDIAFLGAGDDVFQWDPGDGSDIVEGQANTDTLLFNASAANEILTLSANGARTLFTRNVGAIVMDVNDVEAFTINALGGADSITINDLTGTDVTGVTINLSGTIGGTAGDGAADTVAVDGSAAANAITVTGAGTSFSVSGLQASVAVNSAEGGTDSLRINGLGGNDSITATTLPAGVVSLLLDGGSGNDTIMASQGADTIFGGDGADFVFGDNGNDVAFLGAGNDVFQWDPGDGNDVIEGQADHDELRFNGSNASESINILANGGRLLFMRDVAAVTMDMDDVERVRFNAIGGTDTIVIGDLSGTDATNIDLHLEASGGGGDGALDTVAVDSTNAADTVAVSSAGGVVSVTGLPWTVSIFGSEGANDQLNVNGLGGDDVINASTLAAGLVSLTVNAGLGGDVFIGSAGADLFNGGDGNDTALLGAGDDVAVWNPGDDNDIVEGQGGTDTLRFNGSNIAENISITPNGGRALFFRDIANVTMDLNDTEVIEFAALGGADTITVGDLSATDVTQLKLDLAATIGGATGDAQSDLVTLNASGGANVINLTSATGTLVTVTGLPATVTLSQFETTGAVDRLTILALGGNDTISALDFVPRIATLTIDGGGGDDTIRSNGEGIYNGGDGNDLIFAGLTNSLEAIDGGTGVDTLDTTSWGGLYVINLVTGVTNYSGESFINFENLLTGVGDDTITGTAAANIITTQAGVDSVLAGGGDDIIAGGADGDSLNGEAGIDILDYRTSSGGITVDLVASTATGGHATGDTIAGFESVWGSSFSDTLIGESGASELRGFAGNDILDGGLGDDTMVGGLGNDTYFVDSVGDVFTELVGEGTDTLAIGFTYSLAANLAFEHLKAIDPSATTAINLTGNTHNNQITGNAGVNQLVGNAGNDILDGGLGADKLTGGQGDDVLVVDDAGDQIVEIAGQGTDTVEAWVSYSVAGKDIEILQLKGSALNGTGNTLANLIIGNSFGNILNGGVGADTLEGGLGDDTYVVDNAGDVTTELTGQGTDLVQSTITWTLANFLENLTLTGGVAINGTGNTLANTITGNNAVNTLNGGGGNDWLDGGLGNDTMIGGLGNDTFIVNAVGDIVTELAGQGTDKVQSAVTYTLSANVEELMLMGATNINGTGNAIVNKLYGNAGKNILDGQAGADLMYGGLGDDTYIVDNAGDKTSELAGEGNDTVQSSISFAIGTAEIETVILTGAGGIDGTGNSFNNAIIGNSGANTLTGVGGDDKLNGGLGNDILVGGAGLDEYWFDTALGAGNVDTLSGFNVAEDTIHLDRTIFSGITTNGALQALRFWQGTAAHDADDRIIYDKPTGRLYYDPDGTGAAAQVLFAQLTANTALTNVDIITHS